MSTVETLAAIGEFIVKNRCFKIASPALTWSSLARGAPAMLAIIGVLAMTGCATVPVGTAAPKTPVEAPGDPAVQLLQQAAAAHGMAAYSQLHDISVRYEGKWLSFVTNVQPVLCDVKFRGSSEERLLTRDRISAQLHHGPDGLKYVLRDRAAISVWYNGRESKDADVLAAAALVADDYRMFLLGPFFFLERGAPVSLAGRETVEGRDCDNLLAVLRPGIGLSAMDRTLISIDRTQHLVRRLRITVNGMSSTQGAVADVFLRDYVEGHGVMWPTHFFEQLRNPFDLPVHEWRLLGIDLDRGLTPADLHGPAFSPLAARPAGDLPAK